MRVAMLLLTQLPVLFSRNAVADDGQLAFAHAIASRQLRLVKGVFAGSLVLCFLAFVLDGPGPILSWAAQHWPDTFDTVVTLLSQPITRWELAGSLALTALLVIVCSWEWHGLARFLNDLETIEASSSVRDAMARLQATTPAAARYVVAVEQRRNLRVGDWRIAREIAQAA